MEWVALWFVMAIVVGLIGQSKGKSGLGWFFFGLLVWPIALLLAIALPATDEVQEERALAAGGKKCPDCAEIVKSDARVCRFCRHEFG